MKLLETLLAPLPHEFYRGDSFQVYQENASLALNTSLRCRTAAIAMASDGKMGLSDVRISIGIGKVKKPIGSLGMAKGEAFVLSGRAFDDMSKTGTRLGISSGNPLASEGLQIIADYLNAIFKDMTVRQAEIIFALLQGETQQEIAKKIKKSKSTIHQHVVSARWFEIEKLLKQYDKIIHLLS